MIRSSLILPQPDDACMWIGVWKNASIAILWVCGVGTCLCVGASLARRARNSAQQFVSVSKVLIVATTVAWTSTGVSRSLNCLLCSPGGWADLVGSLTGLVLWVLVLGPLALFLVQPELAASGRVVHTYEATIIIAGPPLALGVWLFRDLEPVWVLIVAAVLGFLLVLYGAWMFGTGKSLADLFTGLVRDRVSRSVGSEDSSVGEASIKPRLTSAETERAWKRVLDEAYPPSPARAAIGAIVLAAGSWLFLTAADEIIERLVQR